MSKYIKLEDAIEQVKTEFYGGGYQEWLEISIDNLINRIANLPTIDIIHCGECKCCRDELIEEYMPLYIYCEKWDHETDFDSFCSAGERIDNE